MTVVMSGARRKQVEDFHVLVHSSFPKAFVRLNGSGHVPLKIGMVDDLRNAFPGIEKSVVEAFMDLYTSSPGYQQACVTAGVGRVDLHGMVRGYVTEHQAAAAKRKLEKLAKKSTDDDVRLICEKTGKMGYSTGGLALENARHARLGNSERREAEAYRCTFCNRFHWGHKKPWSFVARADRNERSDAVDHPY
jgi:Activator of osmoprotectant transporter ProP